MYLFVYQFVWRMLMFSDLMNEAELPKQKFQLICGALAVSMASFVCRVSSVVKVAFSLFYIMF